MGRALKKLLGLILAAAGLYVGFYVVFFGLWVAIVAVQSLGRWLFP